MSVFVSSTVQTEAPVNLTHTIADAGGDETGHKINLTWQYPVPSHLQYGWITLVYELQYRREAEPDNWKVQYNENLVNSGSTPGLYILLLSLSLFFFCFTTGEVSTERASCAAAWSACGQLRGQSSLSFSKLRLVEQLELLKPDDYSIQDSYRYDDW